MTSVIASVIEISSNKRTVSKSQGEQEEKEGGGAGGNLREVSQLHSPLMPNWAMKLGSTCSTHGHGLHIYIYIYIYIYKYIYIYIYIQ